MPVPSHPGHNVYKNYLSIYLSTYLSICLSVCQDVWGDLKITDRRDASVLGIKASGWTDTVVWNPLKESMGSSKFVCVECAKAAQPVTVPPGAEWVAAMLVTPGQL